MRNFSAENHNSTTSGLDNILKISHEQTKPNYDEVKFIISDATIKNWDRLSTPSAGRLTARANKRKSKKRVLPLEYFSNKENMDFVLKLLDYIDENKLDIMSVILSLGLNLLKKVGLQEKKHVCTVLNDYADLEIIDSLISLNLPIDEYDILGLVYQSYLQEGKKNVIGSYYTPKKIAKNMTKNFDFSNGELFFDPCCGSGAFLIAVSANNPNQIFGVDNDRTAVLISKINLLLKYSKFDFIPQIYCFDFLMGSSFLLQHPVLEKKYDYIATNPPWGAMGNDSNQIYEITSKETFSYFFVKAFQQLKENGTIRFLFPESILNVKTHKDIRKYILEVAGLASITTYDDMFSGVATKYIDIECGNNINEKQFTLYSKYNKRNIDIQTVFETENLVFNLLSDNDISIIEIVKNRGKYNLKNSVWALGIVTGNNKGKLFSERLDGMEKIYTGKEIQPFILNPAKNYIKYDRSKLQQVAKDEIYRAPEKLVYKFISNKLVFAYDDSSSLFLNSANILIPAIPSMSIKSVLAFLNSSLFQFMYIKLFGEVKILKGNLTELPFPKITTAENRKLTDLVDEILKGNIATKKIIDDYIFEFYGLDKKLIEYIRRIVNGKPD